ncbi:MAG: TIGR03663 family protein [Herpetosiphon sp.]
MATTYSQTEAAPRLFAARRLITLEQLLYVTIAIAAVIMHLYALGDRALHHDETLHAQYSWRLYTHGDYIHDPLLHGPFLYYVTAAVFLIFGDSDTTARLSAALFGIALTLLPMLLRRHIGRGAALTASLYLLVSPVALYIGRFIRHDIFAVVWELVVVIGILQYVATKRPGWLLLTAAAAALMLTTMETFYLFMLIVGSWVFLWLLWQTSRRALAAVAVYLGVEAFLLAVVPRLHLFPPLPGVTPDQALDVRNQPDNNWAAYFRKVGTVIAPFLRHPSVVLTLLFTIALGGVLWWLLWGRRDGDGRTAWRRAADQSESGTLLSAFDHTPALLWAKSFGLAFALYGVLFTGLLSNLVHPNTTGLLTGISGSFLYWLGQHGVRRGGQPAHFYLVELGLYEPLLILGAILGAALVARRWLRSGSMASLPDVPVPLALTLRAHQDLFIPSLLTWWSFGALLLYSWAGEKMPWLTLHLVLPLTLLSAWAAARLWRWTLAQGWDRRLLTVIAITWTLLSLCIIRLDTVSMNNVAAQIKLAWIWPLAMLLVLIAGIAGGAMVMQRRGAVFVAAIVTLVALVPLTVRSSARLSYQTGDVPVEPMVFVQTSPDVVHVMHQLAQAVHEYGSVRPFNIRYDNETVWQWYLRNYKTEGANGSTTIGPLPESVHAVFMLQDNEAANKPFLTDWVSQRLPLRWWLPECEVYRFPATDVGGNCSKTGTSMLSRLVAQPWNGQAIVDWWRFVLYRRVPAPLGSTDWVLYVRATDAYLFGLGRGQP